MMAKNEVMVPAVPKSSASASVELAQEKSSTVANGEVSKEAVDKKSAKAIDFSKIKLSSFGQRRTHSQIVISPDAWLLTIDDSARVKLENPPSLSDGLDARTELDLRYLGCEIIQSGAIMLRLPQVAAATAQILYQRFYYQRSFVRHHFEYTVMACLLLASKIEEAPRRPRDVINVFHRLEHLHGKRNESKKYVPMLLDRSYVDLKNQVIKAERKLLNALGFVVHVHHPHKLIYAYLLALDCLDNHELMQKAWSYMNDGLRTDIFLRYRPETIACACIYLAARTVKRPVALPQQPFPWYEAFDASDRDVKDISLILLKLYCRARAPNWSRLNDVLTQLRFNPDSVFQKNLAAASESKEDKAKSALERKRREVERKAAEMEQKANGLSANKNADRNRNGLSEKVREKEQIRQIRTRSESSSRSRSHSRSPAEPKKFRSSPLYARRRRRQSASRDRGGSANVKRHHKSHRDKEERRKAKEIKRAEKDRRRRSRSRDDRRRLDRERNQREREKDIFQVLGKRRQDSESPEPISKYRR